MDRNLYDQLKNLYADATFTGALGGQKQFYTAAKEQIPTLTREQVKQFLHAYRPYQLHAPARKHFKRSRIFVRHPGDLYQADLMQMTSLRRWNKGIQYLLTIIDVFTKYVWLIPLKDKTAKELHAAMAAFLERAPIPENFQTDKGGEFKNALVEQLMTSKWINQYFSQNETKCAVVERVQLTLKLKIYRWLTEKNTWEYLPVLDDIVDGYNRSKHSSTGYPPAEIDETNTEEVFNRLFPASGKPDPTKIKFKYAVGDEVRISEQPAPFRKSYYTQYGEEVFTIHERLLTVPPRYKLADQTGEVLEGSFYEVELMRSIPPPGEERELRLQVLKRRTRKGRKEVLVHNIGYPKSSDRWMLESDTRKL